MSERYYITGIKCPSCLPHLKESVAAYTDNLTIDKSSVKIEFDLKDSATLTVVKSAIVKVGEQYGVALVSERNLYGDALKQWVKTYYPLLLIVAYIILVSTITTLYSDESSVRLWMQSFMAGFFLVFSFFKFLDIRGFADAYASYDLLAKHSRTYGLIYPFIELALGVAYLTSFAPFFTYLFTLILMIFSSLGVIQSVMDKRKLRCACLGTSLNLPMTALTIVEDLGMALMSLIMLLML